MKYIIISLFASLLFFSCISTNVVLVDFKEPAEVTFRPDVVNVVVVDNTYMPKRESDSVSVETNAFLKAYFPDSAQIKFTEYLAKYMKEENYFNDVIYYPHIREEYDSLYVSLKKKEIEEICIETGADALISVDRCMIWGVLEDMSLFIPGNFVLSVSTLAILRTYNSDGRAAAFPFLFSDTLYWEGSVPGSGVNYLYKLPTISDAIDEAVSSAADKLTNLYIPHWQTSERLYYSDNSSEMKQAAVHVGKSEWNVAAFIWGEKYGKEEKPEKKARLASNIALANECLDDVDNALVWNEIALEWMQEVNNPVLSEQIVHQKTVLTQRKSQKAKLKRQYGEDESDSDLGGLDK